MLSDVVVLGLEAVVLGADVVVPGSDDRLGTGVGVDVATKETLVPPSPTCTGPPRIGFLYIGSVARASPSFLSVVVTVKSRL
jgi:hypothetical protein